METYFWREGRTVNYDELLEVLKQIINRKVIDELAEEEINKLYVKIFDSVCLSIKVYLESKNFKIINVKQGILTAQQIKFIDNKPLWEEALERRQFIENGAVTDLKYEKSIKEFIKEDFYPALRLIGEKLYQPHYDRED